jgi:hypothetical protein
LRYLNSLAARFTSHFCFEKSETTSHYDHDKEKELFVKRIIGDSDIYQLVRALLVSAAVATLPLKASAVVECSVTPYRIFVDSGVVWIQWTTGAQAFAPSTDPAAKYYYASTMMALASGRSMTVRYSDGQACNTTNSMIGLWIN